jgi:hypothetical protein
MARRARAPRGRAPHRRGLPARGGLPLRGDRHARPGPPPARGRLCGHPPAHDDSRRLATDRRDAHGGDRRRSPLPEPAPPRRLSRPRPTRAPVGRVGGPPRPHLKAGRRRGAPRPRRGGALGRARAGAAAGGKAVQDVLGVHTPVQRCIRHKERNVADHLPERDRPVVRRRLRRAWAREDHRKALEELRLLASELDRSHPGAAASLREGMEERARTPTSIGARDTWPGPFESGKPPAPGPQSGPRLRRAQASARQHASQTAAAAPSRSAAAT